VNARESLASARLLMEKLYRRNPRELRKGNSPTMEAALARAFNPQQISSLPSSATFAAAKQSCWRSSPTIPATACSRSASVLRAWCFLSYGGKTEFYLTDSLDAQKLYNCARNIEIAAWKLANARDARGEPLILSNEIAGDVRNLSFEREFGKMIAYQDVMAQIAAQRTNRTIRRIVQTLATAVFLPI
jgi:hypothetical protein